MNAPTKVAGEKRVGGKKGTPETYKKLSASIVEGSLQWRYVAGKITQDELAAAEEIASIYSYLCRDVTIGNVSYEPRIDISHFNASLGIERIGFVRMEVAYTKWRDRLVDLLGSLMLRSAAMDMICIDEPMTVWAVANKYKIHPRSAERALVRSLDLWIEIREQVDSELDVGDLVAYQAGLM